MASIDIKYFNPATMRPGSVVLVVGRRNSGKSTLVADLLSYQRHCRRGVCVSATERANPFWGKYIPQCFIDYEYSDNVTKKLFKMQARVKKQKGEVEPAFAIYDDCLFDRNFMKSKQTRRLFMNGRHDKINVLVTAQWLVDIPPSLRGNCDYLFVLKDNIKVNRERVYKYFAGMFDNFATFDHTMQACTQNFEALVLDLGSLSYEINESVFFYKATPGLQYRVGAPEYWNFSDKRPFSDDDDDDGQAKPRVRKQYPVEGELPSSYTKDYASSYRNLRKNKTLG